MNLIRSPIRWLAQAGERLTTMWHSRGSGGLIQLLNRTSFNYAREAKPDSNSIVIACTRWLQRTFSEAPPMLERWLPDRKEWEGVHRDPFLDLLERPNPFYNGTTLWKAIVADAVMTGTAYWYKVRSASGKVVQIWWLPESTMEPIDDPNDPTVFIDHYNYSVNGQVRHLRVEDVVQFRDGIDPANPRKGLSGMRSLLREVFTDDEAANMTASLLRNMGVPGLVIIPKGPGTISQTTADQIKQSYMDKFSGDKKGEPLVLGGDATVEAFGFSPEQMQLRSLRGVPEERITAVIGVNAAVVGLGAGLATTKVGATLREYREEAFESTVIPMYREIASEITHQLLGDFMPQDSWRLKFDLAQVRVLQEDNLKRSERVTNEVVQGLLRISEGRRALGYPVLPEHEIYLRPANLRQIPAGELRIQTNPQPTQDEAGWGISALIAPNGTHVES